MGRAEIQQQLRSTNYMKTKQQIIEEAAVKIGELVHPAACLDGFREIVRVAVNENSTMLVPMARAAQMWPNEMPSCQIVDGGILVDAKTVALAAQEMMHTVYEQAEVVRAALTAITRNQSEKAGEEGICPFGCDAQWIAMSALGVWKDPTVAAWKPSDSERAAGVAFPLSNPSTAEKGHNS